MLVLDWRKFRFWNSNLYVNILTSFKQHLKYFNFLNQSRTSHKHLNIRCRFKCKHVVEADITQMNIINFRKEENVIKCQRRKNSQHIQKI